MPWFISDSWLGDPLANLNWEQCRRMDISSPKADDIRPPSPISTSPKNPCPPCVATPMFGSLHDFVQFAIVLAWLFATVVVAQNGPTNWTATPFNAPALPLAVRSPYLSVWLEQGNNPASLVNSFPDAWDTTDAFGWYSSVVVDDTPYKLLAETNVPEIALANQTAVEFSATRTSFIFTTGPMQINMSFISPIEPTDLVRQSIPFSYITMSASSIDGNTHNVRMFINTNGELITGDSSLLAQWDASDDGEYTILTMQLQNQRAFTEIGNHAQDAVEYFCFKKISGTSSSWAITNNNDNHALAANTSGTLGDQADTNFRAVNDNWPTLGIAVDWTAISETPEPAVWAVGVVRSPSIQYRTSDGSVQERYPYFLSTYNDGASAAKAFLDDFSRVQSTAAVFDAQIVAAGQQYSEQYGDLLALSARQLMGSMDITVSRAGSGGWNTSDVKVFMKNMGGIGSDGSGTTLSVNTVDTMYAVFPALLYLNSELAGYLLSPLLEYQDSSAYTLSYAARNIGSAYPNATANGINFAHDYGVEESANMLIMTLAYSQRSGNGTFLSTHYTLLRSWAEYLESNSLTPTNQRSPDSVSGSSLASLNNQTNLALKGIIGISCMAKIAEIAGVNDDRERFANTATSYISQWQTNAIASDNSHINLFYGQTSTNGLIYNLYADKLLQLNLVPTSVYDVATSFYDGMAGSTTYGIPLDNEDSNQTTSHWMLFAASTVTSSTTQNNMISQVHSYVSSNRNSAPFPAIYDPSTGSASDGVNAGYNSPAAGAMFSLLALNTSIQSSISLPSDGSTIPSGSPSSGSATNAGAIAGGVVGGIVALSAILAGIFFWVRRRRRLRQEYESRVAPIPIMPSELSSRGNTTTLSTSRGMPFASDGTDAPAEQKILLDADKRSPVDRSEPSSASDTDATAGNNFPTRPAASLPGNGRAREFANVLRGALDDREHLTREITSIRQELELLRRTGSYVDEAPPSYAGASSGRYD
ncbi:hypothetical protein ACEPAF_4245 [Sanghuangporus sanghuang]